MRFAACLLLIAASLPAQRTDTVVRAAGRPVHAGVADLKRDLAVGILDGDQNYMIGAIDDIAVAPNGTMYVLDRSVPAVRVYDAGGKFVQTIGRRGSGPGEFRYASAIALAKNGNLLLWDQGNARVNVYTANGDVVASWPTMGGSGTSSGRGLMLSDTTGTTYLRTFLFRRDGQKFTQPKAGWLRFGPDGKLRDTLLAPESPSEAVLSASNGGRFSSTIVPFSGTFQTQISPLGYLVTGLASRLAIDLHEPNKSIASIRRDVPLRPVTARERDSARTAVITNMRELDPSWSWSGPDIPKTKAAFTGLYVGADGNLWVELQQGPRIADDSTLGRGQMMTTQQRAGAGNGTNPGVKQGWPCPSEGWSLYDIYEPSGRYLGQIKTPEKVEPIVMRGEYVWAATCSDDDAPQVVRYRINWR